MSISPSQGGHIIEDQYEVLGDLGDGSHGQVIKVIDHRLGRICALKFYRKVGATVDTWKEAQALQSLRGNFILPVHHAGLAEGMPFIITDVASNGAIYDRIESGIGLPVDTSVRWIREACQGVVRMHDSRMVHRDIKPANLFLDSNNKVLVGDLGTASLLDEDGLAMPHGTPSTMAPEVVDSLDHEAGESYRSYSVRSEIYSLGATLWWMLGGTPPPPAGSSSPPPIAEFDLWAVAPHVQSSLRRVVHRAMKCNPGERFDSVSDFDAALGNLKSATRKWRRVPPHQNDHIQCFEGIKGKSAFVVCAIANDTNDRVEIEVSHLNSGRRRPGLGRQSKRNQLSRDLRATFKSCS